MIIPKGDIMKLLHYLLLITLISSAIYAKEVSGTFKLNSFRDNSGNSFDTEITVKYKIESLMGEPVVKATAKYEVGDAVDIDGKSYPKSKLSKEQLAKLKIIDLVVSVPFDTTYTGQGTNTLYIDISIGAIGKQGKWSFNPPNSPDWGKWIYVNEYQYLDEKEAKKAYLGLKRLGYGKSAYDSLAKAKKIEYSVSKIKPKKLKDIWIDEDTGLMWQDERYSQKEIENYMKYYKQHKNVGKTGSWYYAKEYCQDLILDGFNDWRLPSINELDRIKDKRNNFKNMISRGYWSSTRYNNKSAYAFSYKYYDEDKKPWLILKIQKMFFTLDV